MTKKITVLLLVVTIVLGVFGLTACTESLADYKAIKSQALQDYADAKCEANNYCTEGLAAISATVTDGKAEIDKATSVGGVDTAYKVATDAIDEVEEDEMNGFKFTVKTDKTTAMVGDKITVTLQLKNLSDDDILIEIPDWIATEGGSELKDIVVAYCLPINSGFDWTVESIAIEPRPRVLFRAKELIEKEIEFIVSDTTDLEIFAGAFFYVGDSENNRFNKQITITKNSIKIQIDG